MCLREPFEALLSIYFMSGQCRIAHGKAWYILVPYVQFGISDQLVGNQQNLVLSMEVAQKLNGIFKSSIPSASMPWNVAAKSLKGQILNVTTGTRNDSLLIKDTSKNYK